MIDYSDAIKAARMSVVRTALAGGSLELLEGDTVLARIPLQQPVLIGSEITFAMSEGYCQEGGYPDSARMVTNDGQVAVKSMQIGTDVALDQDRVQSGQSVRMLSAVLRHA
jgi:hypothetical protein